MTDAVYLVTDLVRDGLVSAVLWALPLAAAAVVAAMGAGSLASRFGVTDPTVGLVARAFAVLAAVLLISGTLAERAVTLGEVSVSHLPALQRPVDADAEPR